MLCWDHFSGAMHYSAVVPHLPTRSVSGKLTNTQQLKGQGRERGSRECASGQCDRKYLCHNAGARSPPHVGAIIAAAAISIPYVQTPCMSPPPPPRRGGRGVARHGGCCRRRRRKHARRLHSPRHPCRSAARWRLPQLTDCN